MKMKKIVCKFLFLGFIAVSVHSCSDDFLTEQWEIQGGFAHTPPLYVFPDEGAKVYPIVWEDVNHLQINSMINAPYTIIKKPNWFIVASMTGQFTNGITEITCSAVRNESFTASRIYEANMSIEIDGIGKGILRVGYVNSGASVNTYHPVFFCQWVDMLDFGSAESQRIINISNNGNGILIWKVEDCPKWISMVTLDAVFPYYYKTLTITCNRSGLPDGIHTGSIVFSTNDKDQPTYTITVQCQVGDS